MIREAVADRLRAWGDRAIETADRLDPPRWVELPANVIPFGRKRVG